MVRSFIRHPIDVPVSLSFPEVFPCCEEGVGSLLSQVRDISMGGISLRIHQFLPPHSIIKVAIHLVKPNFETFAQVVWCVPKDGGFELGLQFMHYQDEFAARMIEQVCHIEHYRKQVLHQEGRRLSAEAAAEEWISQYAGNFPTISSS